MLVLGLDEAGRGAVLGPLVVGAFLVEDTALERLRATGVTDSKLLSAVRREALLEPLAAIGRWAIEAIQPAQIDEGNLNTLEEDAFVRLILSLRPDRVIIDAPCNPRGIPAFCKRLLSRLDYTPGLLVEPKADLNHHPCGAASVFAKVHRDQALRCLGAAALIGSGYPSDPITRAWLQGFLSRGEALPDSVRRRWGTIGALQQQSLFG